MKLEEYTYFYHNTFKLAYADLVAIIADKPQQIIFEIENSYSHLMVYLSSDDEITEDIKQTNLDKAFNHLVRATIDCYKILWTEISDFLDNIMKENITRTFAFNENEAQILNIWNEFKKKAQKARQEEMKSVGIDYNKTILLYKEAVDEGRILLEKFDYEKFKEIRKFDFFNLIKTQWIGFVLGILAGIISTWIMS
jgi:hypothetical protein